ncbi:hypothetical protein A343_0106 [Porphyromonas gingivalis JCVI SC001]|nr:hypothetical protein A343_0106 [Porphyromonas gingivalis JCVI SC001]
MGKVSIHLKDELILIGNRPSETVYIGGTKTQFTFTLSNKKLAGELGLQIFYDLSSTIGRSIINDQDMKTFIKIEDGMQNLADILALVISRYDDDFFHYNQMPEIANLRKSGKNTC